MPGESLPEHLRRTVPLTVPRWVVPTAEDVHAVMLLAKRVHEINGMPAEAGCFLALRWARYNDQNAPISKNIMDVTRNEARAESWLACGIAAGGHLPTKLDYRRMGAARLFWSPKEQHEAKRINASFAYGVWTGLDWLLGRREEAVVPVPSYAPGAELYVPRPDPDPVKRAELEEHWRVKHVREAREHWTRLREIADAQVTPTGDQAAAV